MSEVDPDWCEREYNPRLLVADAPAIYGPWAERAAETRSRHPPVEIRYGDHPREVLDLFRARSPRGAVIFIHGGYWRAFSKAESSWVADGFLQQGLSVVVPSYPLCPDVDLARIVSAIRTAFVHLHAAVLTEWEKAALVVTGHSAGGYLTALHLATDWTAHGLPADPLRGAVSISGVFRLAPLIRTSMNEALRLDEAAAARLSLHESPVRSRAALALVVGEAESAEFHRQSSQMAEHWRALDPERVELAGCNHFDVIDGLASPGSQLNRLVVAMVETARP